MKKKEFEASVIRLKLQIFIYIFHWGKRADICQNAKKSTRTGHIKMIIFIFNLHSALLHIPTQNYAQRPFKLKLIKQKGQVNFHKE